MFGLRDSGTPAEVPPISRFQQTGLPSGFPASDRAVEGIFLLSAGAGGYRGGHEAGPKPGGCAGDRLEVGSPFAEIFFRVVEDLTSLAGMRKRWARVTRDHRGVVEQV